jgi:hypothetical protein
VPSGIRQCKEKLTGLALKTVGAYDLAWEYLVTALGQNPEDAQFWMTLEQVLREEGHLPLAEKVSAMRTRAAN